MKIKGIRISVSPFHITVVAFFIALFIFEFIITGFDASYLYVGIPLSLLLLLVPIINSYSVGKQYPALIPEYERESKYVKISQIGQSLNGKPVKIEGVVQKKIGWFIGRPGYIIYDGTSAIAAQRSVPFDIEANVGDSVAVYGMVMKRFAFVGKYVVHAVIMRISEETSYDEEKEEDKVAEKDGKAAQKIKIKKYNI